MRLSEDADPVKPPSEMRTSAGRITVFSPRSEAK
jgi:hypothetical protein